MVTTLITITAVLAITVIGLGARVRTLTTQLRASRLELDHFYSVFRYAARATGQAATTGHRPALTLIRGGGAVLAAAIGSGAAWAASMARSRRARAATAVAGGVAAVAFLPGLLLTGGDLPGNRSQSEMPVPPTRSTTTTATPSASPQIPTTDPPGVTPSPSPTTPSPLVPVLDEPGTPIMTVTKTPQPPPRDTGTPQPTTSPPTTGPTSPPTSPTRPPQNPPTEPDCRISVDVAALDLLADLGVLC